MGQFERIYAHLPVLAQHAAVSAYGAYWYWLRFGPGYNHFVQEYRQRESFSTEEWQAWQKKELQGLLDIAANKVPYYLKNWSTSEKKAALAGKLEELPLLEKAPIRAAARDFWRQDVPLRSPIAFHTSGSTGTPVVTFWTIDELRNSMAIREVRSAGWAGVSFRLPRSTFSGRMAEPDPLSSGPFYRFNMVERQVYLSPFHLSRKHAGQYVQALHRHRIEWLTGYAVSYYLLAKFILELKLQLPSLKAVVTTSEKVMPNMRRVMEEAYRCKVYEEYSTVENVLFASECPNGRLHVSPDAGLVEILRPDGNPCSPGEVGEVVATGLIRRHQLFIRLRLGDLASWDNEPCPCGRQMPVIKELVGRLEDIVIGPDGRQMVRFHGIFVNQPHVSEGQVIQETLERIRIKVVPTNGFGLTDVEDITHRIQQRLGTDVNVIVETVEAIPRTTAGKYPAVISMLRSQGVGDAERIELDR